MAKWKRDCPAHSGNCLQMLLIIDNILINTPSPPLALTTLANATSPAVGGYLREDMVGKGRGSGWGRGRVG